MAQLPLNAPNNSVIPALPVTPATVTVELVTLAKDSKFVQAKHKPGQIFTDFLIMSRFEKDPHVYMMPVASPGGFLSSTCAFVQLAEPTLLWVCDWTASRTGTQPDVPDPASKDPNWVLLGEQWEPVQISLMTDGVTPLYRVSGTFVYGHKKPDVLTTNNVSFPRPPWIQDVFDRSLPAAKLKKNFTDSKKPAQVGFITTGN